MCLGNKLAYAKPIPLAYLTWSYVPRSSDCVGFLVVLSTQGVLRRRAAVGVCVSTCFMGDGKCFLGGVADADGKIYFTEMAFTSLFKSLERCHCDQRCLRSGVINLTVVTPTYTYTQW